MKRSVAPLTIFLLMALYYSACESGTTTQEEQNTEGITFRMLEPNFERTTLDSILAISNNQWLELQKQKDVRIAIQSMLADSQSPVARNWTFTGKGISVSDELFDSSIDTAYYVKGFIGKVDVWPEFVSTITERVARDTIDIFEDENSDKKVGTAYRTWEYLPVLLNFRYTSPGGQVNTRKIKLGERIKRSEETVWY